MLVIVCLLLKRSSKSSQKPAACLPPLSPVVSESYGNDLNFEPKGDVVLEGNLTQEGNEDALNENEGNEKADEDLYDNPERTIDVAQTTEPEIGDV